MVPSNAMNIFLLLPFLSIASSHVCVINRNKEGFIVADCSKRNLSTIPDNLPPEIQILDLTRNNLSEITNVSFQNYRELIHIYLDYNNINRIHTKGFEIAKNLTKLTIVKNCLNISDDSGNIFLENVLNIAELDLSRQNHISQNSNQFIYPDGLFGNLKYLKNLSMDMVKDPVLGPGFKQMNLTSLRFQGCYLKMLDDKTFKNLPASLKELHLSKCYSVGKLDNIQNGVLRQVPSLNYIDLSWTKITLIKGLEILEPFQNKKMEKIDLGHMKTEISNRTRLPYAITLTANMTKYLRTICVKTLILCDNNIVDIFPDSLWSTNLACLEYIDLSGNRFGFSSFSMNHLSKFGLQLSNLKAFDFSYLLLSFQNEQYLDFPLDEKDIKEVFEYDPKEKDLRYCAKKEVESYLIPLPENIQYMRFTHVFGAPVVRGLRLLHTSKLTHVDISYFMVRCFPEIQFVNESENVLEFLDISGIECWRYYNKTSFPLFTKLKKLIMSEVEFYQAINVNKNVLMYAPNLEYLDLSWNGLWKIPRNYLTHLKHLKRLHLSNNHLKVVPPDIRYLPNLIHLDMTDNELFTIFSNLTSWFDSQMRIFGQFTLKIHLNEFYCACREREFIRWLKSTKIRLDKLRNYKCRLQNGSFTKTNDVIAHFHDLYVDCDATTWLRLGIVLVSSVLTIVLPIAIIYNFRWRITFFCYRKFRKIVERSMNLTYQYDVYLSYGYNGLPWIKEVLIKQLETKWNLNICLEDRDFIGGGSTSEQIAEAIYTSRHLIFVLTSDFMSKPFASYEIDRAIEAKTARTLQNIIIITLDSSIEDIPTEMQSIWSDISAIEWPQNATDTKSSIDMLKTRLLLNF